MTNTDLMGALLHHAERQTSAVESIRNYVFYLLLIVVIGLVVGVLLALSGSLGI